MTSPISPEQMSELKRLLERHDEKIKRPLRSDSDAMTLGKFVEYFTRFALGLISVGMTYLISTTVSIDKRMAVYDEKQYAMAESMRELKNQFNEFVKQPRFTLSEFEAKMLARDETIKRVEQEQGNRRPVIESLAQRVTKLESTEKQTINMLAEIKAEITLLNKQIDQRVVKPPSY